MEKLLYVNLHSIYIFWALLPLNESRHISYGNEALKYNQQILITHPTEKICNQSLSLKLVSANMINLIILQNIK